MHTFSKVVLNSQIQHLKILTIFFENLRY